MKLAQGGLLGQSGELSDVIWNLLFSLQTKNPAPPAQVYLIFPKIKYLGRIQEVVSLLAGLLSIITASAQSTHLLLQQRPGNENRVTNIFKVVGYLQTAKAVTVDGVLTTRLFQK